MKVSDLTANDIADFLRLDSDSEEAAKLGPILDAAIDYAKATTGLDLEDLDLHSDITLAVMVLCQDMYDNRAMYVDKSNANRVVTAILHQYRQNFV